MPSPRFFIIDQSLRDFDGHHFEYDMAVACAARDLGYDPVIVANRGVSVGDAIPFRTLPWFGEDWTESRRPALTRAVLSILSHLPHPLRGPLIALASRLRLLVLRTKGRAKLPPFGGELVAALDSEEAGEGDHVFIHTLAISELHAALDALSQRATVAPVSVVLRRDAEEPDVSKDPWGGVAGAWRRAQMDPGLSQKVRFFADTAPLAAQYNEIFDSSDDVVTVLPIPHVLPEAPVNPPGPALRLVYLGNARTEKGFHLLADAMEVLREKYLNTGRLRLVAQSNFPSSLDENIILRARRRLAAYPQAQVELIDRPLSVAEFQSLLFSADIVVLPYDAALYRRRSSGILIQALVSGKPVVVPADSWLSAEAGPARSTEFSATIPLADAIAAAVERFAELNEAAKSAAPATRDSHTARRLVELVLNVQPRHHGVEEPGH